MQNLKEKILEAVNIYKSGDLIKAEKFGKDLVKNNPNVGFLYNFLGIVLAAQNKIQEAIKYYENGIKVDPKFAMIYNNLGIIYFSLKTTAINKGNYIKKAEDLYKKSIELEKKNPEPFTNLGTLYNFINKNDDSIKYHKIAIEVNPKFYHAYLNLANVYVAVGNFSEAKKKLIEAIKINSNFIHAHRLLSRIIKYKKNEPHLSQMISLYANTKRDDKMYLAYALGKAYEDIGYYDESFNYYKEANLLNGKNNNFIIKKEKNKFLKIKEIFNKELFNKFTDSGSNDSSNIFIVGMPRSGTTLVEQILSSHTDVFGADEVEFVPDLVKKYFGEDYVNLLQLGINNFKSKDLKKMGDEYVSTMKYLSNTAKRSTDKLPANFLFIGLIKLILPHSKIIHCHRNPKDNIFSIFKNYFSAGKINYSHDLKETVEYYKLYYDLIKHWNNILPNFIHNIKYEDLIKNTRKQVKDLLYFCNLKWEDKCLEFYNTKRPIKTASDTQVRNKIYNTSINSWKNYEKYLIKNYDSLKF